MNYTREDFMKLMGTLTLGTAGATLTSPYNLLASQTRQMSDSRLLRENNRNRLFDEDWQFHRGDAPGAELPDYNDSDWQQVQLPHDWSIEDLPHDESLPSLSITKGTWHFSEGDNMKWKSSSFNDSSWKDIKLPSNYFYNKDEARISSLSALENTNTPSSFVWYRKDIAIPQDLRDKDFKLNIGKIAGPCEIYFNGILIGGSGQIPISQNIAGNIYKLLGLLQEFRKIQVYKVPSKLVQSNRNIVAVRVYRYKGLGGDIYAMAPTPHVIGPFSPESVGGAATGHTVGGVGWYRKDFKLDRSKKDKIHSILFEGVYMKADTWINGHYLGRHPYGYTSFEYDITPYLKFGNQSNVLSVRVDNEGKNSRWYSGSGIYRHVWLQSSNPVHFQQWGAYVTTPKVSERSATVEIESTVKNDTNTAKTIQIQTTLVDKNGKKVGKTSHKVAVDGKEETKENQIIKVNSPNLWAPDSPYLYEAQVKLVHKGKKIDQISTTVGIRTVKIDADQGLTINGEPITLRGGCMHHDNGPLGSKAVDRAEERRVELMKKHGFNAIRTSHNPPSPAFLDACDRLGILVMDEAFDCWDKGKNPMDYHLYFEDWWKRDIESMVKRDRNHPSVIFWSIGNEIPDRATPTCMNIRKKLVSLVHQLDPTRSVTEAINPGYPKAPTANAYSLLDVGGYNYAWQEYEPDHKKFPKRIMIGTETFPNKALENWQQVEEHSWVIGSFVWTGMDYLGESGIGQATIGNGFGTSWPWYISNCGDIDTCGFKKPQSYYRDIVWRRSQLEMAVHAPIPDGETESVSRWGWPDEQQSWNWPESKGKKLKVNVYSRYPAVRLELNGKKIGEKQIPDDSKLTATFEVPYEPGELRASGIKNGSVVSHKILKTAGKPKTIRLTADRSKIHADSNDLSYITVEITDAHGQRVPNIELPINFKISGVGELAAVGNGNPHDMKSFQTPHCKSFKGRCLAILRPKNSKKGTITLRATAEGITSAVMKVHVV